jgi:hypothetical protein
MADKIDTIPENTRWEMARSSTGAQAFAVGRLSEPFDLAGPAPALIESDQAGSGADVLRVGMSQLPGEGLVAGQQKGLGLLVTATP